MINPLEPADSLALIMSAHAKQEVYEEHRRKWREACRASGMDVPEESGRSGTTIMKPESP
jgi:hypothetical protein